MMMYDLFSKNNHITNSRLGHLHSFSTGAVHYLTILTNSLMNWTNKCLITKCVHGDSSNLQIKHTLYFSNFPFFSPQTVDTTVCLNYKTWDAATAILHTVCNFCFRISASSQLFDIFRTLWNIWCLINTALQYITFPIAYFPLMLLYSIYYIVTKDFELHFW